MAAGLMIIALKTALYLLSEYVQNSRAAIQCSQPEIPENGHALVGQLNNLSVGAVITYQCDVGFILVGHETLTCQQNGSWSGAAPVCAVNVALYKPAIQSSTLEINDITEVHYANLSTDGNFEGMCSATDDEKVSWWQVDLLESYKVYAIELLIPSQWIGNPLKELHIVTSSSEDFGFKNKTAVVCYKHDGPLEVNRLHTFICAQEVDARFVRIASRNVAIQLCEVVVLSKTAVTEWQCGTLKNMNTWGAFGGKCYYGSLESMPWFSANTHCEMTGSTLPVEIDVNNHQFLIAQIKYRSARQAQSYWLGLSNSNRAWTWNNGKSLMSSFWADPAANDVAATNMAYAAAMAQPAMWNWMPSLQSLWYYYICQAPPKFCSSPGVPFGGSLTVSNQQYSIGSTAYYSCGSGLVVEGPVVRTCLDNGTWSSNVPKCTAVDCGRPDIFLGASVKYLNASTAFGSLVEYQCPLGQRVGGKQIRICQADGTWSGTIPQCDDVNCGHPGNLEKGRVIVYQNSTKIGGLAEYSCEVGFTLMGATVRHCSSTGTWLPVQVPICFDVSTLQGPSVSSHDGGYQTSLMVGFIVAVIVLLAVILIVFLWLWKKKKLYDNFSTSTMYTTNSNNAPASASANIYPPELLYAYPSGAVLAADPKENHYYVPANHLYQTPSVCRESEYDSSIRMLHANDLLKLHNRENIGNGQSSMMFVDQPQFIIRAATAEQLERVVNNINLTVGRKQLQQQQSRLSAQNAFHTIRKVPGTTTKVFDLVRKKLSEANFNPPDKKTVQVPNQQQQNGQIGRPESPTPSELFSFDDDDDANFDHVEHVKSEQNELSTFSKSQELPLPNFYHQPADQVDCNGTTSLIYSSVDSCGADHTNNRRSSTCGDSMKIYDLPPDAAARMNENLAKVLMQHAHENLYESPPRIQEVSASTDENVCLGNGVEIVHTYC